MDPSQLESWFEQLRLRTQTSPLSGQDWVSQNLSSLETLKDQMMPFLLRDPWPEELASLHQSLTQGVETFLRELAEQEGPTGLHWFNEPWQAAQAFLQGADLRSGTGELFEFAYQQAQEMQCSLPLQEQLRELMLWGLGHLQWSGLELQQNLQVSSQMMQAEEGRWQLAKADLLSRLEQYRQAQGEEQEEVLQQFLSGLDALEAELIGLEEEALGQPSLQLNFEWLFAYMSKLFELSESEQPQAEALERNLEKLRQEWGRVSEVLVAARLESEQAGSLTHVRHIQGVVAAFQEGTLGYSDYLEELRPHHQRLQQVTPDLLKALQDQPEQQQLLRSLDGTLKALASIRSPGDPQLDRLCSAYCDALEQLVP